MNGALGHSVDEIFAMCSTCMFNVLPFRCYCIAVETEFFKYSNAVRKLVIFRNRIAYLCDFYIRCIGNYDVKGDATHCWCLFVVINNLCLSYVRCYVQGGNFRQNLREVRVFVQLLTDGPNLGYNFIDDSEFSRQWITVYSVRNKHSSRQTARR